jgi:hypothetical protein
MFASLIASITSIFAATSTSGPNSPTTAISDSSTGVVTWTTPGNVTGSDTSYATVALSNANKTSYYIKATGFNFAIPTGVTIKGITVEVQKKTSSATTISDNAVRIVKGGVIGSTDKSNATTWPTTPTTGAYTTYGSGTELWGETWTSADINNANFGLAFSAKRTGGNPTASVNNIRIRITYTTAPTLTYAHIQSNNTFSGAFAKIGQIVKLNFT